MNLVEYIKKMGSLKVAAIAALPAAGYFVANNALPLFSEYRNQQRDKSGEAAANFRHEDGKSDAQRRDDEMKAFQESQNTMILDGVKDLGEGLSKTFRETQENALAALREDSNKLVQRRVDEYLKSLNAEEKQQLSKVSEQQEKNTQAPKIQSVTKSDITISNNDPDDKQVSEKISSSGEIKTFPVFANEPFSLCGYDGFVAKPSASSIHLENLNRDFPFRYGFRNWETSAPISQNLRIFEGCDVSFKSAQSSGTKYILVSVVKTTPAMENK